MGACAAGRGRCGFRGVICCSMAAAEFLMSFLRLSGVVLCRVWIAGWFRGWDLYVCLYSFCRVGFALLVGLGVVAFGE